MCECSLLLGSVKSSRRERDEVEVAVENGVVVLGQLVFRFALQSISDTSCGLEFKAYIRPGFHPKISGKLEPIWSSALRMWRAPIIDAVLSGAVRISGV